MEYTQYLEDYSYELWGDEDNDVVENVIGFLNDPHIFRTFGVGLSSIIRRKMTSEEIGSEKEYLKKLNNENGKHLNRNTIDNWFEGNRPKKGNQSREHMFLLSFLLGLSISETCELFQKVYFDKPFNFRSIKEFIYFYCLKNKLPYSHAQDMYAQVIDVKADQPEGTLFTKIIKNDMDFLEEDHQVLEYIRAHPHNFQLSNKSAVAIKNRLLDQVLPKENDRLKLKNRKVDTTCSFIVQEIALSYLTTDMNKEDGLLDKNKSVTSISSMLDIILGINMVKAQQETEVSIFKNANLPQEIMNRFPTKHTFSKSEPSFEELRKMIILLFSYKFWFLKQYSDRSSDIDDYQMQLDSLLFDANLQPLYYGNPFDWMFLYCTINDRPLDMFRSIMAEALLFGDVNESYK